MEAHTYQYLTQAMFAENEYDSNEILEELRRQDIERYTENINLLEVENKEFEGHTKKIQLRRELESKQGTLRALYSQRLSAGNWGRDKERRLQTLQSQIHDLSALIDK